MFAQTEKDLGIDFLDWNPSPADKSLGLWRDAYLTRSGPVTVRNPEVVTHFLDDSLSAADLTLVADLVNHSDQPVSGTVRAALGKVKFQQQLRLEAGEHRVLRLTPDRIPQLHVTNPKVWWPYHYGTPHLERLRVAFSCNGAESDSASIRFGISRVETTIELTNRVCDSVFHRFNQDDD